jgi:hypothetical protein
MKGENPHKIQAQPLAVRPMDDTVRYIIENNKSPIKIGNYLEIGALALGGLLGGSSILYNVYKFDHPDLLLPGLITVGISLVFLLVSIKKIKIENSYEPVWTGLSKSENDILCKEIIKDLFEIDNPFGEEAQGLFFLNIESFLSWGKQITMISTNNKVLINCRDVKGPYSLLSRGIYMKRLREAIKAKGRPNR